MVSIKTGSNILMEKAKGTLQMLNGCRQEEAEERLKGPWRMEPRLWEVGTPPDRGFTPRGVSWLPGHCSPAIHHPSSIAKPACLSLGWGFKGDFTFSVA